MPNPTVPPAFPSAAILVALGYEIADCNPEGLTDFDEALRIACERLQGGDWGYEPDPTVTLDALRVRWAREFPGNVAR